MEKHGVIKGARAGQVFDFGAVVVDFEILAAGYRLGGTAGVAGRGKGDGTGEQGGERRAVDAQTAAAGLHAQAAVEPETAVGGEQAFVGAVDEDGVAHSLVGGGEIGGFDGADDVVFIQHGAADIDHFAVFAGKKEPQAALADGGHRR